MYTYTEKKQFSPHTGEPVESIFKIDKTFCDLTGKELPYPHQELPYPHHGACYTASDIGGSEEWWYYTEFFLGVHKVRTSWLVEAPFIFYSPEIEQVMGLEFVATCFTDSLSAHAPQVLEDFRKEHSLPKIERDRVHCLADFLLECRFRVLCRLVIANYTESQLQLTFEED